MDKEVLDGDILNINFNHDSIKDIKNAYLVTIFLHEKQLKSLRLISGINIYLKKNGESLFHC